MKKSDFDKNIKIYSIASTHYQGLGLKSILQATGYNKID